MRFIVAFNLRKWFIQCFDIHNTPAMLTRHLSASRQPFQTEADFHLRPQSQKKKKLSRRRPRFPSTDPISFPSPKITNECSEGYFLFNYPPAAFKMLMSHASAAASCPRNPSRSVENQSCPASYCSQHTFIVEKYAAN